MPVSPAFRPPLACGSVPPCRPGDSPPALAVIDGFPPLIAAWASQGCGTALRTLKNKGKETTMKDHTTQRIATLNDDFRRMMQGGQFFVTPGIAALPYDTQAAIIGEVRQFDDFTKDNDPYGEHDFGAFTHDGLKIFWKIDCYAPGMECGSEDPSDPNQTVRVLTIMLAEEY